jgi:ATP-dependent Clp protease protease subunit
MINKNRCDEDEVGKKEDKYDEEFYYKLLNKNRYILLYDEIDNISGERVCSKLRAMNYLDKITPITLEIDSPGGMVCYGLSIVDTINSIKAPVYTVISGEAASMAAMISVVGAKRFMTKNAVWMEHCCSDLVGDYLTHIKDRTNYLIKLEKQMDKILKQKTKLNDIQMNQIKNGELWLFSKEALKYGVVDKII